MTAKKLSGFTMIELLVVIAVIGILAVALLATLNPLEQIRKGRDTRTRADMSQLISALERYNASIGYFPWQSSEGDDLAVGTPDIPFLQIGGIASSPSIDGSDPALTVATALDNLTTTNEVKPSFIDRVTAVTAAETYLFYDDESTGSVIACFTPESQSFQREAFDRCAAEGAFPTEFEDNVYAAGGACPSFSSAENYAAETFGSSGWSYDEMICLP